jgi:hypothetical protein
MDAHASFSCRAVRCSTGSFTSRCCHCSSAIMVLLATSAAMKRIVLIAKSSSLHQPRRARFGSVQLYSSSLRYHVRFPSACAATAVRSASAAAYPRALSALTPLCRVVFFIVIYTELNARAWTHTARPRRPASARPGPAGAARACAHRCRGPAPARRAAPGRRATATGRRDARQPNRHARPRHAPRRRP